MNTENTNSAQQDHSDTTLLAAKPYGPNVQHVVFGIHGTANNPSHVQPLTEKVGTALANTPNSGTTVDTSFDWSSRAGFMNQPGGREKEGDRFAAHVDKRLTEMTESGQLDPNKPIQISVVGFSHGGNVAIAATPELADVMRKHGFNDNGSLHLVTVSTPAYNNGGNEDPAYARKEAAERGLAVHHTHFATKNDGVIRGALANAHYDGPGHPNKEHRDGHVYNYGLEGKGFFHPIGSHGAAQDDAATSRNINNQGDRVADIVAARTIDIHNRNGRERPGGRLADGDIDQPSSPVSLAPDNDRINKQFEQALKGTGGDRDAAAVAVDTISKAQGYKPDQDINVIQGKNGLIVSQGEGPAAINLQVPQAQQGDFDRVAAQMAAQPQQNQQVALAQATEQQERKPLSV